MDYWINWRIFEHNCHIALALTVLQQSSAFSLTRDDQASVLFIMTPALLSPAILWSLDDVLLWQEGMYILLIHQCLVCQKFLLPCQDQTSDVIRLKIKWHYLMEKSPSLKATHSLLSHMFSLCMSKTSSWMTMRWAGFSVLISWQMQPLISSGYINSSTVLTFELVHFEHLLEIIDVFSYQTVVVVLRLIWDKEDSGFYFKTTQDH